MRVPNISMWPEDLKETVHVWVIRLVAEDPWMAKSLEMLDKGELHRACGFKFEHLMRRFIISHACLRKLLGTYLCVPAPEVKFGFGARGKPFVDWPITELRFNYSYSGDLAAFAFTSACEIGIDIEAIRPLPDMENIAASFFSRYEVEDLSCLDASVYEPAFFATWTRKEAYIKAVGDGLFIPLDSFRVSVSIEEEAPRLTFPSEPRQGTDWQMHSLDIVPGYLGTIAYQGSRRSLRSLPLFDASELPACGFAKRFGF